jgi:hypothetical protein
VPDGKSRSRRRCLANMRPEPVEGCASTGAVTEAVEGLSA